jgi:uncharacterized Zn-binding protein involved in type VI secretion
MPAAKQGDQVLAVDIHIIMIPSPGGPVPTPIPHPFMGILNSELSTDVKIQGVPAAVVGSVANNTPPHIPMGPGPFQKPPSNRAKIITGSTTVKIGGKGIARLGDTAMTCNDPADLPVGTVIGTSTVLVGG